jgi:hypothetical protein
MREFVFLFLYGAVSLTAFFLSVFWSRFAAARYNAMTGQIRTDRYFLLSAGIAGMSGGLSFLTAFRTIANVRFGISKALYGWEGWGVGIGLTLMLGAMVFLVALADLEDDPPLWRWTKWLVIITTVWIAATAFIVYQGIPDRDLRPTVEDRSDV